jgi:peptidylprolyl isomerase domain and WD repeat-containing protein 1
VDLCLCPGDARIDQQMQLARMDGSSAAIIHRGGGSNALNDSLLVALAYGKRRFYASSHVDPLSNKDNVEPNKQAILARDVLNEAPNASNLLEASHLGRAGSDPDSGTRMTTALKAVLRTTHSDIVIKLFKDTPRMMQNFMGHMQSGYYDNVVFHRIIPGFMIQTGDPLGDGTGGIWGGEFKDEIWRDFRHNQPFTVSMANASLNTNGLQFFITMVPTPWLDNKHTVFGRVVGGMEVVMAIESVKMDQLDRPLSNVKILSIDLS